MKAVLDFKMETRPYGDGYTNMVGIVCGWCRTEAWHPAKNGGWAVRIFRATGWKVGGKRTQDRCPACFGKAKNARRRPDNPVLTPEQAKAIKASIKHMDDTLPHPTKTDLLQTSVLVKDPVTIYVAREATGPETDPAPPADPPAPATAPPLVFLRPIRGQRATPGRTVFRTRRHAADSGQLATGSNDGLAFFTMPLHDGWTWKHDADTTPEERATWLAGRKYGPRITTKIKEETPMTEKVVPIKDPMPSTLPATEVHADPARKPTRDERNAIHDELTKVYDPVTERYAGGDSDKVVSERLDVPRLWVTEVREMFFGSHDRNQQAIQKIASLDKAIALAKRASTRLLEMAAEADTLERELVAARNQLEG